MLQLPLRSSWLALAFLFLLPRGGWAQWVMTTPDCAFPATKHYFNYVGDDLPLNAADSIKLARAATAAAGRFLKPHALDVVESERAYADGHYAEAAAQLAPFAGLEPPDLSLLNQYARSLYKVPDGKPLSYTVYNRLITILNRYGGESRTTCVVYLPFAESYYKLATLQMDNAQWDLAAYNISRALLALAAMPELKSPAGYQEMLQYQTECFAALGNARLCRYYGLRTLKFFPKNQYVKPYLARFPAAPKARR